MGQDAGLTKFVLCDSAQFLQANSETVLKFSHDRFLSHPLQFIIQYHPNIRRYINL